MNAVREPSHVRVTGWDGSVPASGKDGACAFSRSARPYRSGSPVSDHENQICGLVASALTLLPLMP
jgi:hypothetical protein